MIKLKEILTEAPRNALENEFGRTISINKNEFEKLYSKRAMTPTHNNTIFRYIYNFTGKYGFINPKASNSPRKSAFNNTNYYTILFDNLPSWKNYPKRSESIICTNDKSNAADRTQPAGSKHYYIVIPLQNAKIAICPEDDIWFSFNTQILKYMGYSDNLSDFMIDVFFDADKYNYKMSETYKSIKKYFNLIDNDSGNNLRFIKDTLLKDKLENGYNMLDIMNDILDPNKNGFELKKVTENMILPSDSREIWTSDKCLLIRNDIFKKMK